MNTARERLRAAGLDDTHARLDSEVLARHALGWDRATWITRADAPAPEGLAAAYQRLIDRRASREPVAYIVGSREFHGRDFAVTPSVLVPRPETELIVDYALAHLPADTFLRVVDVGTGSGALAVTLAAERPEWHIEATDLSRDAITVARRNATTHGVAGRLTFLQGDLLAPTMGAFDVIVSNPPYVPARDAATLDPDVRDFEPALALFGGDDGLDVIRVLIAEAAVRLVPGGWLLMEFGIGQREAIVALAEGAGLRVVDVLPDLQGIPRTLVARR